MARTLICLHLISLSKRICEHGRSISQSNDMFDISLNFLMTIWSHILPKGTTNGTAKNEKWEHQIGTVGVLDIKSLILIYSPEVYELPVIYAYLIWPWVRTQAESCMSAGESFDWFWVFLPYLFCLMRFVFFSITFLLLFSI